MEKFSQTYSYALKTRFCFGATRVSSPLVLREVCAFEGVDRRFGQADTVWPGWYSTDLDGRNGDQRLPVFGSALSGPLWLNWHFYFRAIPQR